MSETSFFAFFSLLRSGRLTERVPDHGALLVTACEAVDAAARERPLDELVDPVAVALLERRALRLTVVGEDDDLVRPRCVGASALDAAELLIELAQRLERVGALEAGVVRHLVVARERRVDGGPTLHHVLEDAVDDQVADEHAERAAHQRVVAAAMAARLHVAALRAARRRDLERDLPEREDEHTRDVEAVREERAVARVRALLGVHPADGEDHVVGLAREEVAAARAAVAEQAVARVAALDLRAIGRSRARHRRRRLLLDPAERRNVLVRAEQDAGLGGTGLRGEVCLPLGEDVALVLEPARHVRGVAVAHRPLQDGQREAVDLEVDDPRCVGLDPLAGALRDPLDHAQRVGVVVVRPEDDVEHDSHCRRDERDAESRPERVDLEVIVRDPVGCEEHEGIERRGSAEARARA